MALNFAESSAVFYARLEELGLSDLKAKFVERGWTSHADFAMASSDFSGKDNELFTKEVVTPLVGDATDRLTKIRRLFVQSYAVHAADMERMANPQPEKPVQLHALDREEALANVKQRLTGVVSADDTEPSWTCVCV